MLSSALPVILLLTGAAVNPVQVEKDLVEQIESATSDGRYKKAVTLYRANQKKYKSSIRFRYVSARALLYFPAENEIIKRKNYKEALRLLKRAENDLQSNFRRNVKVRRLFIKILLYSSLAHEFLGNDQMTSAYLLKVTDVDDKNLEAWYNLGNYYERKKNFIKANRAFSRYLKILNKEDDDF